MLLLVGQQEQRLVCKKLSGGMLVWLCVWVKVQIAYGSADATAIHYFLLQLIQIGFTFWFYLFGASSPR